MNQAQAGGSGGPTSGSILYRKISVLSLRASLWVWLALAILVLSFVFHIIAFSIVEWGEITSPRAIKIGLWQRCEPSYCSYFSVNELTDAYRCTQAFATMSFLLLFSSLLLTTIYIFYDELQDDGFTHICLVAVRGVTVLFLMVTFSVWSAHWLNYSSLVPANPEGKLGPSFGLEVTCFVFELVATGLLAADFVLNVRRKSVDE